MLFSFRFSRKLRMSAALLLLLLAVMAAGRLVWTLLPVDSGSAETAVATTIKKQVGKTEEQRQEFLKVLGWEVDSEPYEVADVLIPKKFDEVYARYNAIQKGQGLDLEKYRGKRCKRYAYLVHNHPSGEKTVRINLLVYGGKIVGGDVCSLGLDGFMHGLIVPVENTPETTSQQAA